VGTISVGQAVLQKVVAKLGGIYADGPKFKNMKNKFTARRAADAAPREDRVPKVVILVALFVLFCFAVISEYL
jgi:hypothetical protein